HLVDLAKTGSDMHKFMSWSKPFITDSGGFQVLSLIHNRKNNGEINDKGLIFLDENKQKVHFNAEKSIQTQISLGADILICLDDCTKPDAPLKSQEESVQRTITWANRCKDEFIKLTKDMEEKPLLFAVIQGGNEKALRKKCAQELLKIGFDGYCYGGWPVDETKTFLTEILNFTASLIPDNFPKYAMGVGKPQDIVNCFKMGYNMFDCVIPTREARHKKLYRFTENNLYETISLQKAVFKNSTEPVSKYCDCLTCQNYSLGYLYHLFKINDLLAFRLATIHNLRFYSRLMEILKDQIN
ncbi:hypothetical protein A2688_00495, partial [Candidatus Daviesbacteria bacterium RIFCSPHIGHO2_01_FULL_38_8]